MKTNKKKKVTKEKVAKLNNDNKSSVVIKSENADDNVMNVNKDIATNEFQNNVSVTNKKNLSSESKEDLNNFVDLNLLESYGYQGIWNEKFDENNPVFLKISKFSFNKYKIKSNLFEKHLWNPQILKIGRYRVKSNKSLLNVENLNMLFKNRGLYFKALNNVSFSVNEGDLFGIIGESGSGKSTTGKCIIKLHQPSGGKIEIANNLVSNKKLSKKTRKWLRKNVQMIFQDPMSSLNPTKNILQLISEPLSINKSLYKETFEKWKLLNNISRYLYLDFIREKNILLKDFRVSYLSLLIEKLKEVFKSISGVEYSKSFFDNIRKYKNDIKELYSNLNFKDARERLIFEMDTLVEKINTTTPHVYEFTKKFENLISSLEKRFLNQDYADSFKRYEEIESEYFLSKEILDKSNEGKKVSSDLEKAKKMLKDYKSEFKEIYHFQNRQYIKSWEATIKGQIKNIKQEKKYSKDQINYSLHYVNLMQKEFELIFVKSILKNKFVNEDFINDIIIKIEYALNKLFSPIFTYINKRQEEFEYADIDLKNKIIDRLLATRMIAKIYVINFKENKWNDFTFVKEEIDKILSMYPDFNLYNFDKIEDYFEFQQKINSELYDLFVLSIQHAIEINETYRKEKRALENVILTIQTKLKNVVSAYENSSKDNKSEHYVNQENFTKVSNLFNQAKNDRKIHVEETIKGQETLQLKAALKQSDIEFYSLLKNYENIKQDLYSLIKLHLIAIKRKMIKNYNGPNKFLYAVHGYLNAFSYFKKEIKLRWKSLSAIEFEYKHAIEEVNTNSFVCESSRYINWINYFKLFESIKVDKVYKALDSVGLKREHAYRYPHEFSGGQRQRIVIARALINNPKIIIADEPISALDVSIQAQIINILQDLSVNKNVTVLFIAHDLSMVNYVCNNVIIMHRGRILEKGNVNKIFAKPIHPYTRSLMKATPKLSRIHVDLASFDEEFTYDRKWSAFNQPKFIKINNADDHEVFGTIDQINEWIKLADKENDI